MDEKIDARGRKLARLSAVQALYQMEIAGQKSKLVVSEFNDHWFKNVSGEDHVEADKVFFEMIVLGVVSGQKEIDSAIADTLSEKWSLKRLDTTLRAIMRCAAYEILHCPDIPAIVVVDQYVSIATDFYDGGEPAFVNAALDKLGRKYRAAEFA